MKVIEPASLVREAAEVLAPIWEDVVVIGAAALQILLADDLDGSTPRAAATRDLDIAIVTPTRDVDLAVEARLADAIVARLEEAGLEPSEEPYERGYTWIRNDLKIQLVRPFHPFPSGTAGRLPQNPHLSLLARDEHRLVVAFRDARDEPRLQTATEAALVALKQVAAGPGASLWSGTITMCTYSSRTDPTLSSRAIESPTTTSGRWSTTRSSCLPPAGPPPRRLRASRPRSRATVTSLCMSALSNGRPSSCSAGSRARRTPRTSCAASRPASVAFDGGQPRACVGALEVVVE